MKYVTKKDIHGECKTPLWNVWNAMLQRCYCKTIKAYRWYGARGITVCKEWKRYIAFRNWAHKNGYTAGLSIDRRDGNKGYCPSNCRWISRGENARLNRNTHWWLTAFGETKTIGQWLQDERTAKGLKETTIRMRIARGWDVIKSLTKPAKTYKYH